MTRSKDRVFYCSFLITLCILYVDREAKMAGICENGSIRVSLLGSHNTYITYPVYGILTILETGNDNSIINAIFQEEGGAPVVVKRPTFLYQA